MVRTGTATAFPVRTCSELAHDLLPEAVDRAPPAIGYELHFAGLPRLEAHGGAGGDVEPHAAGLLAVEAERRVGFEEVVMRTHLDRTVTGVRHLEGDPGGAGVEFDFARCGNHLARDHDFTSVTSLPSTDRQVASVG